MKLLHKSNLFCWSQFDEDRNIDFHSYVWVRPEGYIVFDPLALTKHDGDHLQALGGVSTIIISNSDHVRDAQNLAKATGAEIWGPAGEKETFPVACARWLHETMGLFDGLDVYGLSGSKTDGELAFVVEGDTLITGDLVRAHAGGALCMLPDAKLQDHDAARQSVKRVSTIRGIVAILPGDGWPVFRHGGEVLAELVSSIAI